MFGMICPSDMWHVAFHVWSLHNASQSLQVEDHRDFWKITRIPGNTEPEISQSHRTLSQDHGNHRLVIQELLFSTPKKNVLSHHAMGLSCFFPVNMAIFIGSSSFCFSPTCALGRPFGARGDWDEGWCWDTWKMRWTKLLTLMVYWCSFSQSMGISGLYNCYPVSYKAMSCGEISLGVTWGGLVRKFQARVVNTAQNRVWGLCAECWIPRVWIGFVYICVADSFDWLSAHLSLEHIKNK